MRTGVADPGTAMRAGGRDAGARANTGPCIDAAIHPRRLHPRLLTAVARVRAPKKHPVALLEFTVCAVPGASIHQSEVASDALEGAR